MLLWIIGFSLLGSIGAVAGAGLLLVFPEHVRKFLVANLVPRYKNLLVTRTLSKAYSLAGFRVGYAILPLEIAEDLNSHNDAYPLARPSEAAAIATLQNEGKILDRAKQLHLLDEELAGQLRGLGIRTFPSSTYFFWRTSRPMMPGNWPSR